ncbi:MAG TPA: cytochrome-c peroxidase [Thiobacillaceae bacterium]|nr:cytochrome-c peroxidase [Thiobacillaceae bacterium]
MPGFRGPLLVAAVLSTVLGAGVWLFSSEDAPLVARAYAPPATDQPITPIPEALDLDVRKVELGRKLFHDKRLSRDDSTACASCHELGRGGMDGRPVAVGVGRQMGSVNSPSVLNSAFNFSQFWDGRAATLEEQAAGPVHNPIEMASNWDQVVAKLSRDAEYGRAFRALWPDGIQADHIQSAIAEFERSLVTPNSPFDRFLKGDGAALSAEARRGWDLFRNLGCIACHQGVNMGGNMYANLGVMGDYFGERGTPPTKSDLGRYNVTGREADRHVFKVPSLRNVARTAPYFHDGSVPHLKDAVTTMARYQLGLELSPADRDALVAFLEAQNGHLPAEP